MDVVFRVVAVLLRGERAQDLGIQWNLKNAGWMGEWIDRWTGGRMDDEQMKAYYSLPPGSIAALSFGKQNGCQSVALCLRFQLRIGLSDLQKQGP